MTALDEAVKAAMYHAGCRRWDTANEYDFDTCREHHDVWVTSRDVCEVIDDAVRAGWTAAIDAAVREVRAHCTPTGKEEGKTNG